MLCIRAKSVIRPAGGISPPVLDRAASQKAGGHTRFARQLCTGYSPRPAFTLLEVVIALGLSVVLLVTVYSALDLHWKYSTAGREEVERSQLARALLGQMANDIRSVVFQPPESEFETDDGSTTVGTDSQTETTTMVVTDPMDAYFSGSVGVYGDSTTLVLHISKPSRRLIDFDFETLESDLQSVAYFLNGDGASGFQTLVAGNLSEDSEQATGLARMKGGRFEINLADEMGDMETLAANTRVLATEVNSLQFRYFDGVEWLDLWDSVEFGQLPNAIEIIIGFQPPPESDSALSSVSVSAETDFFRLVVALPLAEPYVEDLEL